MTLPKSANKGGRPKTRIVLGEIDFDAKSTKRKAKVKFTDRREVEAYCSASLSSLDAELERSASEIQTIIDGLKHAIKVQTDSGSVDGSLLRMLEQQQQRKRQVTGDKAKLLSNLMKQFELLSALDRPTSEDPRFTPVAFYLNTTPPPEAYVENKHKLSPDDVQPDQ